MFFLYFISSRGGSPVAVKSPDGFQAFSSPSSGQDTSRISADSEEIVVVDDEPINSRNSGSYGNTQQQTPQGALKLKLSCKLTHFQIY